MADSLIAHKRGIVGFCHDLVLEVIFSSLVW